MIIYISGKYSDENSEKIRKNIQLAKKHAVEIWKKGFVAICPHLNTENFEEHCDLDWDIYIKGDKEILSKCDAIVMLYNWIDSKGAKVERDFALELQIPVFYSHQDDDFGYILEIEEFLEKQRLQKTINKIYKNDDFCSTITKMSKENLVETIYNGINCTIVRCPEFESGVKYDAEKLRWDLLDFTQIEKMVDILTSGAKKYSDNNWKKVEPFIERYFAAMMRHLIAWRKGDKIDSETGKSHLNHAACCLHFLMWKEDEDKKNL